MCRQDFEVNGKAMKKESREFPGGPVVRTQPFHCEDLIPGWGTAIP